MNVRLRKMDNRSLKSAVFVGMTRVLQPHRMCCCVTNALKKSSHSLILVNHCFPERITKCIIGLIHSILIIDIVHIYFVINAVDAVSKINVRRVFGEKFLVAAIDYWIE